MKLKYLILIILLFFTINPEVNALCSKREILEMKDKAYSITMETEYAKDEYGKDTGKYNIIIKGLVKDMHIQNITTGESYSYENSDDGTIIIKNLETNNYTFKVIYKLCGSENLRTINYKLPKYNQYVNNPLCKELKEQVDICSRNYQEELSEEEFQKKIKEYRKNLGIKEEEPEPKNLFEKVVKNLINYYPYIILGIIVLIIISIKLIVNRKRGALE